MFQARLEWIRMMRGLRRVKVDDFFFLYNFLEEYRRGEHISCIAEVHII